LTILYELPISPGFDGNYGWIEIKEYDVIFGRPGNRFEEDGFVQKDEFVTHDGTIFVLLEKIRRSPQA
jgi:hypothetical protein